jgi:hypothetical protein
MVHFHEVINSDSNNSTVGGGSGRASTGGNTDLGWVGKIFIALLIFEFISFLAEHS